MPDFRIVMTYERQVTFFVEAASEEDIHEFLDADPDWNPGDEEGLIELVGDEVEASYEIFPEELIEPRYRILDGCILEPLEDA